MPARFSNCTGDAKAPRAEATNGTRAAEKSILNSLVFLRLGQNTDVKLEISKNPATEDRQTYPSLFIRWQSSMEGAP